MSPALGVAMALMNGTLRLARGWCVALVLLAFAMAAHAHLMVAQKGTLNFSGDGAYLVLSLPVSAFKDVDDDGDRLLSLAELRTHAARIERQLVAAVQLHDNSRALKLEGLMLSLSAPDHAPNSRASQLVVMGRYALSADAQPGDGLSYKFTLVLFGQTAGEQVYDITFTRKPQAHAARFTPEQAEHTLFPTATSVFVGQLRSGADHVLAGIDHLLFLLVVMAELVGAGRVWRQLLLTLSCFTAGHALTVVASVQGGWAISPVYVEPAIAATIVGMAGFNLWRQHGCERARPAWRLALVFLCALVHGLGLGNAMGTLGLSGADLAWGLAGFNLGIELAQLLVVAGGAAAISVLARVAGPTSPHRVGLATSALALVAGAWWFVERASGWI